MLPDSIAKLERIVDPTLLPLGLNETKRALRITHDAEDDIVLDAIEQAVDAYERGQKVSLLTQEWRLVLREWPKDNVIELLRPPVQSIQKVAVIQDGAETALVEGTDYQKLLEGNNPRIAPVAEKTWPSFDSGVLAPITIEYTAGYASTAAIPQTIKIRLRQRVGTLLNFREDVTNPVEARKVPTVDALDWLHKQPGIS